MVSILDKGRVLGGQRIQIIIQVLCHTVSRAPTICHNRTSRWNFMWDHPLLRIFMGLGENVKPPLPWLVVSPKVNMLSCVDEFFSFSGYPGWRSPWGPCLGTWARSVSCNRWHRTAAAQPPGCTAPGPRPPSPTPCPPVRYSGKVHRVSPVLPNGNNS